MQEQFELNGHQLVLSSTLVTWTWQCAACLEGSDGETEMSQANARKAARAHARRPVARPDRGPTPGEWV